MMRFIRCLFQCTHEQFMMFSCISSDVKLTLPMTSIFDTSVDSLVLTNCHQNVHFYILV